MKSVSDIIYGMHATRLALQEAPETVLEIWAEEDKRESKSIKQLINLADTIPVQYVSRNTLDKLAQYSRHQGIVIRVRQSQKSGQDIGALVRDIEKTLPLILVLDGIQDPQNLGACLRTADAAGVQAVILPRDRTAGITAAVRKVASGAAEQVPVIQVTNLARALEQLQAAGIWVIGTADTAEHNLFEVDMNQPLALVMGSEAKGLRQNTRLHCDLLISIPMAGIVESLNVSVATGICLYEAVRQRQNTVKFA